MHFKRHYSDEKISLSSTLWKKIWKNNQFNTSFFKWASNSYEDKLTFPHHNPQVWKEFCHLTNSLPNTIIIFLQFPLELNPQLTEKPSNCYYIKISSWSMPLIKRKLINEFLIPLKSLKKGDTLFSKVLQIQAWKGNDTFTYH